MRRSVNGRPLSGAAPGVNLFSTNRLRSVPDCRPNNKATENRGLPHLSSPAETSGPARETNRSGVAVDEVADVSSERMNRYVPCLRQVSAGEPRSDNIRVGQLGQIADITPKRHAWEAIAQHRLGWRPDLTQQLRGGARLVEPEFKAPDAGEQAH
jgi:hypothetical protein